MFAIQMDRKWHYLRYIFTSFARIQKKKEGINPPFDGGYKAPNHLVVWLHSRGDFFRFRSIVDFRMMAVARASARDGAGR